MLGSKIDLTKLKSLPNVDIVTTIRNEIVRDGGKKEYQVDATVTVFKPKEGSETTPQVIKKVSTFAVHSDVETAQDRALQKAQSFLMEV